jgi:hypothetical protein
MGCFNITALTNFDANRIFDLTHYRIWDLVLWWYDLDLIIFDFFIDFFNSISYLLLFINTFFYKIFFNFLNFTLLITCIYDLYVINSFFYIIFFFYIFFFINIIFNFVFFFFELLFFFDSFFSMDNHLYSFQYRHTTTFESVLYFCFFYFIFFFFILFFFVYVYMFSIKNIFSIVCDTGCTGDVALTVTNFKLFVSYFFNGFYILKNTFLTQSIYKNTLFFLNFFNLFLIILFSLINSFFINAVFYLNYNRLLKNILVKLMKQNKYFLKLETNVILTIFKFFKNDVIKNLQLNLVTFLINFFNFFVKDITYLNTLNSFFFFEFFFFYKNFGILKNVENILYTQLTYVKAI